MNKGKPKLRDVLQSCSKAELIQLLLRAENFRLSYTFQVESSITSLENKKIQRITS